MKKIDPAFNYAKKLTCPFCSLGCEFNLILNDFGIKGVDYLKTGSSGGRLCPRGSAAALYLGHPKRLSMPMKKDKVIEWPKIAKELNKIFANPEKLAVTFDRNITNEEYELILSCCHANGIENVASCYLEPESALAEFATRNFDPGDLGSPGMVVVIGDPFNQSPLFSKYIIDWKMSDRKNRLIVIDSISTHTASFATEFIPVSIGAEPLVVYALAQEPGIKTEDICKVGGDCIKEIAGALKAAKSGLIVVSLPFGHIYDPGALADSLHTLASASGKNVLPLVEHIAPAGNIPFGDLLAKNKKGNLHYLMNFGELFPYYYPQLSLEFKFKDIYATSPLRQQEYNTIPFALNLEKSGTIHTNYGVKKLSGGIVPASGARTVHQIIEMLDIKKNGKATVRKYEVKYDRSARISTLMDKSTTAPKKKSMMLLGEKIAFDFMNIFEKEILKINPADAHENGLVDHETVTVESKRGKNEMEIKVTNTVPTGIIAVSAENAATRGLFDFEIVEGSVYFIPTEVQIWRKG